MYDPSSLDFSKGTIWYGESGVGKTYQMIGMLKEAVLAGFKVKFFDWSDVMCKLKCKPELYRTILNDMLDCGVVAIDDFYVDNNYTYDYVYYIIKTLHGANKRILMTASELPAQPKIAMRLAEMTNQYEVVNEWK
jgi:DNA replication protein DnaC